MSVTTMTQQYIQTLYQKTETTYTKKGKSQTKTKEEKSTSGKAAVYEGSVDQTKATYSKPSATVSKKKEKKSELQEKLDKTYDSLSEKAKDYLSQLKEKFGNIDFFVADCDSDAEMNRYFAMGTKQYSCVISSSLIEQMATDETAREKYEGIIANAGKEIENMKAEATEELGEEAAGQIEYVGFTVKDDGVVEYFAKLKSDNDSYYAKLKEKRAEEKEAKKKAEEKENEKKAKEKRQEEEQKLPDGWITADSKENLLAAIKEALGVSEKDTENAEITIIK